MQVCESPTKRLIDRLEGVKQTASDPWIARCPAHDDRSPSLSIWDNNGTTLIRCFGQCAAADIVAAVGRTLGDLFPGRKHEHRPGRRRAPRVPASDLLLLASREIMVVAITAADFIDKRTIDEDGWQRLAKAAARLGAIVDEVRQ